MRVAEEDKGWRQTTPTAWAGRATALLSPAAARHCAAARDRVYIRAADLTRWTPRAGKSRFSYTAECYITLTKIVLQIRIYFIIC